LSSFEKFSESRKSVRNFTGNYIDDGLIEKAVSLSKNAPSVCNRQPSKVYYLKNKSKIDDVLEIQSGLNGFSKNINQLLVVTTDVNYYYSVGERYQFFIDGGVYLMNLLYALHFYKIAACPANWAKEKDDEKRIKQILPIKDSEKVICLIAIGEAEQTFRTTLSKRRDVSELLTIIEN
jgi:nitroreductase